MSLWQAYTRSDDARRTGAIELGAGSDFTIRYNSVGVWSAVADWSDDLWDRIEPGGGLIFRREGRFICSGPITGYGYDVTLDDAGDYVTSIVLEGVTDEIVLADRIVYPDPSRPGVDQTTQTHWRMTGPAEDVMCALVNQQAGPGAQPLRRTVGLTVAPSLGRGRVVNVAIRYGAPNLLAELQTIALSGGLGFRVVPTADGGRRFEPFEPSSRAGNIRYGTEMGNVAEQSFRTSAPTLTYALAGGQGDFTARLQREYPSAGTPGQPGQAPTAAVVPDRLRAAQAILDRFRSGQTISEDWSWAEAPFYVGENNDALYAEWVAAGGGGGSPVIWLQGWINSHQSDIVPATPGTPATPPRPPDGVIAAEWWRRIETYVDARDTEDPAVLDERAIDALKDTGGATTYSFTPVDTDNARLLEHVNLGDRVTVYAGPPGGRRVSSFVDLVREIHGELGEDDDVLRAAVGSEGATTGVPLPLAAAYLKMRAELQALKGAS